MSAPASHSSSVLEPALALVGAVSALALGTSFAKQLFPAIGAQGTSALRVGLSALVLLALWRPWRWPLPRTSVRPLLLYGLALGGMNVMFRACSRHGRGHVSAQRSRMQGAKRKQGWCLASIGNATDGPFGLQPFGKPCQRPPLGVARLARIDIRAALCAYRVSLWHGFVAPSVA